MKKKLSIVDNISVAAPCNASWDDMKGDERARFCGQCQKNVYNLSSMNKSEIESLILEKEGQLCIRFYERKDGTVITENCPVGLRLLKKSVLKLSAAVAAVASFLLAALPVRAGDSEKCHKSPDFKQGRMMAPKDIKMGEMAVPLAEDLSEPWMTGYKKSSLSKILAQLPKNFHCKDVSFFVRIDKTGHVLSTLISPPVGDKELAKKIIAAARAASYSPFPAESKKESVNFSFVLAKE